MFRKFLIPFGYLALSSCGEVAPGETYEVYLTDSLTPSMTKVVLDALQDWEVKINGDVSFILHVGMPSDPGADHQITILGSPIADIQSINGDAHGEYVIGLTLYYTAWDRSTVYLSTDEIDPGTFSREVRHEIGHALGLVHTQPGTMMYYLMQGSVPNVTCADVQQYADLRHRFSSCNE